MRGPTIYGLVFVCCTIVFWRKDPTAVVTLMILCGGGKDNIIEIIMMICDIDGLADVVGRMFGHSYRWSNSKSLAGSVAMFLGGFISCLVFLLHFERCGNYETFRTMSNIPQLILINL